MDAGTLYHAISEVCPALSAKCESATERATWSFEPGPGATQAQIDAGNNVIATIPLDQPYPPSPPAAALYDHEARLLVLEGAPATTIEAYLKKRGLDGRKL
jgi:hypothetical protein